MTFLEVDSSMIDRVGYDEKNQALHVRFINSGDTYCYFDVPQEVYQDLLTAASKGSYMHDCIISEYDYARMKQRRGRRS